MTVEEFLATARVEMVPAPPWYMHLSFCGHENYAGIACVSADTEEEAIQEALVDGLSGYMLHKDEVDSSDLEEDGRIWYCIHDDFGECPGEGCAKIVITRMC